MELLRSQDDIYVTKRKIINKSDSQTKGLPGDRLSR